MNCAFDKEKLSGYYDGELEAAEKAEVERHIASCSECLRELGELKSAAVLVKELPRLRAPRSIAEGVSREIAASGKVHVLASFRRNLMWTAAAAAGLFVVLNVMYFARREAPPAASVARAPQSLETPMASVPSARRETTEKDGAARTGADRFQDRGPAAPSEELRKNLDAVEKKESSKAEDTRRGQGEAQGGRERAARDLAKSAEQKPAETPVPAAPVALPTVAPTKPGAPAAAAPKDEGKGLADSLGEKRKADAGAVTQQDAEGLRTKQLAAAEPRAKEPTAGDAAATSHLTLATTQIAKARPQIEDMLKKLGCALPPPPMSMKGMKSSARESESTMTVELTDSQIARLRQDLEKQGEARLVAGAPDDPLVLSFLRGGSLVFGKKDLASGGGAPSARKKPEPKDRDGKESEDLKAPADPAADKASEPRRKVVLHLLEVKSLPVEAPADPPVKK